MSWFSVPLPNPFKALQFSDDENEDQNRSESRQNDAVSPLSTGVKDDLSAIGKSIGRHFRGVASFLAPPPTSSAGNDAVSSDASSETFAGIRSDLAEIGGSFKTSLSLLSSTRAVSEISKLASNFLQLDEENEDDRRKNDNGDSGNDDYDDDEYEGAGITNEAVEFANKVSNRAELWTGFPLSFDQEFDMSDGQTEHASVIEQLVPSLANLRSTLCNEMTEKQFWMIYFILLLPRLNEDDLEILSTPEIVNARESLLVMLRSKGDTEINSENRQSDGFSDVDNKVSVREMEKSQSLEKATISENSRASKATESSESDSKLVKEKNENTNEGESKTNASSSAPKQIQIEDDVSFSDLEDDTELPNRPAHSRASSPESSDWLTVDDFDP